MGFLDNLENDLKALENQEQRDPEKAARERDRRESERNAALRRAPHVEALKNSAFTSELLTQCRAVGRERRVLVRFTWLGEILRLDANARRLELVPSVEGIAAVFSVEGVETGRASVDPHADDAAALARVWLTAPG